MKAVFLFLDVLFLQRTHNIILCPVSLFQSWRQIDLSCLLCRHTVDVLHSLQYCQSVCARRTVLFVSPKQTVRNAHHACVALTQINTFLFTLQSSFSHPTGGLSLQPSSKWNLSHRYIPLSPSTCFHVLTAKDPFKSSSCDLPGG